MNLLRRWRSQAGHKSLLHEVFSSKRKSSDFSCSDLKNSDREENESNDQSMPKFTANLSSGSIPELAEADSFESIWATRSDSGEEEETASSPKEEESNEEVHSNVSLETESSPSFEQELSEVLQETIEKLPEIDTKTSNLDCEEKGLEIECSDDTVDSSSTDAIFSGDSCDFVFTSESSASVASDSTASPPPKPTTVHRTQDIFRPKAVRIPSPVHLCVGIDGEQLKVKFTPSFEGIEMANSFQQLETIEEEPSWYSPSMSFEMDSESSKQASGSVIQGLKLTGIWILLLYSTYGTHLPINKVSVPLTEFVIPALEDVLVQRPTDGPVLHKTFYNTHHTAMGVWLK